MADYNEDPYAFIIDYCIYSNSQEDFLRCTNLVREDDDVTFCTVGYDWKLQSDLVGVESVDDVDLGKLGFRGERRESLSPKLTKGDSPLVHCSGKFLIDIEVDGDSMVKVVKPLRCVTADGVECSSDELGFGYGGGGGEITAEDGVRKYETEDDIGKNEVEGEKGKENFEESGENVDTEVTEAGNEGEISVKNEGVLLGETEMIEVDEERGADVNDEIGKVDTEVIRVDEEEENNSVNFEDTATGDFDQVMGIVDLKVDGVVVHKVGVDDEQDNCGKIDEETRGNVDTVEMAIEEEEDVNCFDVGVEMDNTCKEEEIDNVDSKMVHVDQEQGNCAKMDGRMKDAGMDEMTNVDSRVVGVDEEQGNCGSIDGNTSHVDTVEFVVEEEEEEEGNGVEIDVDTQKDEEIANLDLKAVKLDVELRNCAKILKELSNVDTEEIVVEEEKKNCGDVGVEICNSTSSEEEIGNVDSKVVGVDQDKRNCAKMDGKMIANVELREVGVDANISIVDTVEIVVEEEEENCVEIDMEINNTLTNEEIANLDSKAVGVDKELSIEMNNSTSNEEEVPPKVEQENCAKFNQETSNVVDMGEIAVEEEERNCMDVGLEMNTISKAHENGMSKIDKDNREGRGKSNEDESREGTRKRKLPPSMFEQWGKKIRNEEGCSKDANLDVNETKKPVSKETAIRCILDAQKFLMRGKSFGGGSKVDFLETAKRRGMTFPKPRFRSD